MLQFHSVKMDILIYYNELSLLIQHIPNRNEVIINSCMNVHIGKDENNKFCLHNTPNRNGEYLAEFSLENRLVWLNTKFQKKKGKTMDLYQLNWLKTTPRLYIYKQKVDNSTLNFWRSIFRS